jgi:hypothetical protein
MKKVGVIMIKATKGGKDRIRKGGRIVDLGSDSNLAPLRLDYKTTFQ